MKTALIFSKAKSGNSRSGLSNRVDLISNILHEVGFSVERASTMKIKREHYDLICIVSFSQAWRARKLRARTDFLWLDAMDSWKLTRKSLFTSNVMLESVRYLRDWYSTTCTKEIDLKTYCSARDLEYDGMGKGDELVLPPSPVREFELLNHGQRFVFVGPAIYPPNKEAFNFLVSQAKIGRFLHKPLFIFGEGYNLTFALPGVFIQENASDEEVYGSLDIHLAPIWRGAGIKYKTLNPLSLGIQVISTEEGATGIVRNSLLQVVKTESEFSQALLHSDFKHPRVRESSKLIEEDDTFLLKQKLEAVFTF